MREAAVSGQPSFVTRLARRRVPLGFCFGAVVLWLARPTWQSIGIGLGVALVGEAIRIWAAGHLEKSREVTASGPYRWTRHPLYAGSAVMGLGVAIASARLSVVVMISLYLAVTLTAAIRTEEQWLRQRFGPSYDLYRDGQIDSRRPFSLRRAVVQNREYRAIIGMAVSIALLVTKRLIW